ncbi:hypothetical protein HOLleu_01429 [Holothuria leucospilota]|uniref:Uncharacterized protein n=1 Tax=Holothuria leucospilota TaxID=206669 RepID=A0A9Q1CPY4_HOLLE|nr:hypothetical protein HOLleu_01429 [Holothuria leucospilota]
MRSYTGIVYVISPRSLFVGIRVDRPRRITDSLAEFYRKRYNVYRGQFLGGIPSPCTLPVNFMDSL